MSSSSAVHTKDSVTLNIYTEDESAEIFVIDGQFNLADRGIGPYHRSELQPGLYKIKVSVGAESREEHIALRPGSPPVSHTFPRLVFSSPAPLTDTSKTHEFHVAAASEYSRKVQVDAGKGSWIFVCARGWTEKTQSDAGTYDRPHPARGLKLLKADGTEIANLEKASAHDLQWEPWSACNVSLPPGDYRLQLEVPSLGRTLEQTVVASLGWQTQIFLLQHDYGSDSAHRSLSGPADVRADLLGASVLMCGPPPGSFPLPSGFDPGAPPGFDPGGHDQRSVELARLALANQRQILSNELRTILRDKFENPMLGIFGAHLLLLQKQQNQPDDHDEELIDAVVGKLRKSDRDLLEVVIANLRNMVGTQHPDVEALALALKGQTGYKFKTPPMLQKSWSLICATTAERPHLVEENSLLENVSESLWGNSIWLTWLTPQPEDKPKCANDVEEAIVMQLKSTRHGKSRARATRNARPGRERSMMPGVAPKADALKTEEAVPMAVGEDDMNSDVQRVDEEGIKRLTRQLGIPRSAVEKSIEALKKKGVDVSQ